MPIWKVASQPEELLGSKLASEQLLEEMIVSRPEILDSNWMLIGRQVDTGARGRLDLLAIAPDGGLVLIELKRNRIPRDVVAQALDYASWVEALRPEDVAKIFMPGFVTEEIWPAIFKIASSRSLKKTR
jgi:RecB family endonuclease NucS